MESRILGDGYVRFGERTMQTYSSNAERRYFPTLHSTSYYVTFQVDSGD